MLDVQSSGFLEQTPFEQLVSIMTALRSPGGCPWDLEQTHQTLKRYLVEETFETIDAIELGDFDELKGELGDLLLQVVFHAQLAKEAGHFDSDAVCASIVDKMIRRHPHVFGQGADLENGEQVLAQWETIKQKERADKGEAPRKSRLDGIPRSLPSLSFADKLQGKAAKVGFAFSNFQQAWDKLQEELHELQSQPSEEELGDVLFACVSVARQLKIDPELALRKANQKFTLRFAALESKAGEQLGSLGPEQLLELWSQAKRL